MLLHKLRGYYTLVIGRRSRIYEENNKSNKLQIISAEQQQCNNNIPNLVYYYSMICLCLYNYYYIDHWKTLVAEDFT